uniref:recombinase family protein n=1 Tax=Mycobacterium sp. TaxID=1785 RepID=UPI003F993548
MPTVRKSVGRSITINTNTIRAGIYNRISKDRTGLKAGVDRQLADNHALAERLGWPVVRIYCDNDVSAFSGKRRPDYQQLCADIKDGTINAVVCWHPDRLHRRSAELETWLDLVGDNVQHATCQAGLWDLSTPSGRMNARILGNVAQYESEHRSERVRAAKAVDARNGKNNGGIRCFGYAPDGVTIWEDEAAEIRRIADAITRGVSLRSLARELNQRGVPTTTAPRPVPIGGGKHRVVRDGRAFVVADGWSQAKLRSVLLSPRLAGFRTHHGEVVAKGTWPPILDETTYAAMLAILEDPKRRTAGPRMGRVPTTLGTGLFRCGVCDQPTMRRAKGSQGQAIYRCGSTADGGKHVSRNADTLDAFVVDAVIARLSQPGYVQAFADRV